MAGAGRLGERSEQTRQALLAAARSVFGEHGYEGTRLDQVTAAAGVTKGALYHHYAGKAELFAAVYETLEVELAARSAAAAVDVDAAGDPLLGLRRGMLAFLDACLEPDIQRIVLIDGLSVLGWEAWVELAQRHNLGLLESALAAAMERGVIAQGETRPLAHLLQGALVQAGMALARAEDSRAVRRATAAHLTALLEGLRIGT